MFEFETVYEIVEIAPNGARSAVKEWWSHDKEEIEKKAIELANQNPANKYEVIGW